MSTPEAPASATICSLSFSRRSLKPVRGQFWQSPAADAFTREGFAPVLSLLKSLFCQTRRQSPLGVLLLFSVCVPDCDPVVTTAAPPLVAETSKLVAVRPPEIT